MSRPHLLLALAAAALTLAMPGRSFAFCVTRTCDPTTAQCEFQGICNISGKQLFWPNSCVSFDVQQDGSKTRNISYDTVHQVVVNAFVQWVNADCGSGTHPSIQIADYGPVACSLPEYNKTQPNANIITFHDALPWPHDNTMDTLALTTVYFDGDSGEIYDANVEINSADDSFADGHPVGNEVDLNAVLTHEVGHFLGLSHSDLPSATMFGSYMPGMATIEQDDISGICAALPPGRMTQSDDCTPRHGFSGECAKPETGCCATAIGAQASSGQTLGLFAFALGLCGWRGRRRLTRSERSKRLAQAPRR